MNLVIDKGNSQTKIATFEGTTLEEGDFISLANSACTNAELLIQVCRLLVESTKKSKPITQVMRCCVTHADDAIERLCKVLKIPFTSLSSDTAPIKTAYTNPEHLGCDRLAAVCGAQAMHPQEDLLIIGAGSCLTYDVLDKTGIHLGGAIAPGIDMRFKALDAFTDKLQMVAFNSTKRMSPVQQDTITGMQVGVQQGIVCEMKGMIYRYMHKEAKDFRILLHGGNADFFQKRLKKSSFASKLDCCPHLVLTGLNAIINYEKKPS